MSFAYFFFFFFQAEDGIRDKLVTGVQTCALPIYLPALGKLLPDEGEYTANVSCSLTFQVPLSQDQRRIGSEEPEFQVGKIQFAHCRSIWIVFLVTRQHAVPAARNSTASGEGQFRRLPVSNQKGIHVAAIPCGLLRLQYGADGCAVGIVRVGRLAEEGPLPEQTANCEQSCSSGSKDRLGIAAKWMPFWLDTGS